MEELLIGMNMYFLDIENENKSFLNKTENNKIILLGFISLNPIHINIKNKYKINNIVDLTEIKNEVGYINGYLYINNNDDISLDEYTKNKYDLENITYRFEIINESGIKKFLLNKYFNK